jgi:hypothetical protein
MFEQTIEALQTKRVMSFLDEYLVANPRWYRDRSEDPGRVYKRDDDLADDFWADPAFRPVAESFYLQSPSNSRLRRLVSRQSPDLNSELTALLINAFRILSKRLKQEPSLLPFTRRLAASLLVWREGLMGAQDRTNRRP